MTLAHWPLAPVLASTSANQVSPSTVAFVLAALVAAIVLLVRSFVATGGRRATDPSVSKPEPEENAEDEPKEFVIEESIDLHFFAPRDIPSVVDEYLWEASARGFEEVRLIHGRGKGVQRVRVHKVLDRHPLVRSHRSDGLGSTLALLRKPAPIRPKARQKGASR